jgi:hypothetical protein
MKRFLALVVALFALVGLPRNLAAAVDFTVSSSGQGAYVINGQNNPTLTLTRGKTYTFDVVVSNHPFWIKTAPEIGFVDIWSGGVTNNGSSPGLVTFAVPDNAPAQLYYQCQFHEPMNGVLTIISAPAATVPATTKSPALTFALTALLLLAGLLVIGSRSRARSKLLQTRR